MIKRKIVIILRTAGLIVFGLAGLFFQSAYGKSPDAIAMRVISNPDHYSALRWYNEKVTVKGSPQLLSVDGYPAVRDGRSVYVSAANVDVSVPVLYTNIYIISYNQSAEQATQDIFGQILGNWRFNTNLDSPAGFCSALTSQNCLTDEECGEFGYCSSFKARVTRDTIRMARLMDLKASLESYKKKKNKYPNLSAGSYLPAKSISVWPSWQESLGKELAATPPIDPINKLAACVGYDEVTCWDQTSKSFAWSADLAAGVIPVNNFVYTYSVAASGASYQLCGYSESGLMDPVLSCNACVPAICMINSCGPDGCGGTCAPGCSGTDICSGGSCVPVCSTPEGCQISLADASPITGYCATGLCYQCNTGFSWTGTICSAVVPICLILPGCLTSAPANSTPVAGTCTSGVCYQCNAGYSWDGTICAAVVPACSASPGCRTSVPANSTSVAGTCTTGACYQCNTGYGWNGATCEANCSTSEGCRASLTNGSPTSGYCATGACYQCNTGYSWDGTICAAVVPACSASPGCRTSVPANSTSVVGTCTTGACYQCNIGYSWNGLICELNCTTPAGCRTSLINASVVSGYCSTGSCYSCNGGYFWDGLQCALSGPACSTPPGCQSGLANATIVAGICTIGACYSCNTGYSWNGTICAAVVPVCSASPGCRTSVPANSTSVVGTCTTGTCYQCNTGYSWNGTTCASTSCLDNDGDGYGILGSVGCPSVGIDCVDSGPGASLINPGATEICDGINNNCTGGIDEVCDLDNDNYCSCSQVISVGASLAVCPNTITTNASTIASTCDCNDAIAAGATVNPGVTEICNNSIDDNCNALTDCSDAATCSAFPSCIPCTDADNDDYSAAGNGSCCGSLNNQVCPATPDCNDTNTAINPGAPEICGNAVDENCDTVASTCPIPACIFPFIFPCTF